MANWTPRVRRINTTDVGEQGKIAFINSLLGEDRFDEAEDELVNLLEANPRSYYANMQMGRLLQRRREFDRAVEHFETARIANPTNSQAPVLAGATYLRIKDLDGAADCFHAALTIDPKLATAHAGLAQVHFRRNEIGEAEARVKQALAFDPQQPQARALLARINNKKGDEDSARREIEEIVNDRPDQIRPVLALARLHLQREQPKQAMAVLVPAMSRHQDSVEAWGLLARARLAVKDYSGAEQAVSKALEIQPHQAQLARLLLESLLPQEKVQEAMRFLDRLPDRARNSPRVHAAYGDVHMVAGRYKQAADSYRASLLHRADGGEAAVAELAPSSTQGEVIDWKAVAERYQAKVHEGRVASGVAEQDEIVPA